MFHLVAYGASLAAGPNLDMAASNDGILGTRNSHLICTEPFDLIAAYGIGALITRVRFNNAQLTQKFIPHVWPLDVSATVPDIPAVMDLRTRPLRMPINEEIILEASNSGAGPTQTNTFLWMAPPGFSPSNIPSGELVGHIRGTVVIAAGAENAWGTPVNVSWERDPLNGVYAVLACEIVAADALAFRIVFPDMVTSRGKQYRPGGLIQQTASLDPWLPQRGANGGLGEWGRFHTFTPPQIQLYGDAAGGTYEVRMLLMYLGADRSLVFDGPR